MKKHYIRLFLAGFLGVLASFLVLTYFIMYRQNHAIPILEYHNISEMPESEDWTVSRANFLEQMAYLNQHCRVVPLQDLLEDMRQEKSIPRNTVAITFDDGYRSNYEIAFPVLKQYNLPATIFITGKSIENGCIGDYPALQWEDMKTMQSSDLVSIESHTYDLHEEIPDGESGNMLPAVIATATINGIQESEAGHDLRIEMDLARSREIIEEKLGTKPVILCWPYGAYGEKELGIAKRVGFTATTGRVAYSYPYTKPEDFARVAVLSRTGMEEFIKLARPEQVNYFQAMEMAAQRIKYHLGRILE